MSTIELKKRLVEKIQSTENKALLEEAYRLLELDADESEVYRLHDQQRKAIEEAKEQIKNEKYLTEEQADKEIDQWLNE